MIEVRFLPSLQVMLSCKYIRYYEPIRLPVWTSAGISAFRFIPNVTSMAMETIRRYSGISTVPYYPLVDVSPPYTPKGSDYHLPTIDSLILPSLIKWQVGAFTISALSGVSPCVALHEATTSVYPKWIATRQLVSRSALYHPLDVESPALSPRLRIEDYSAIRSDNFPK